MPITNENYQKAEDWLNRAKSDPKADKSKVANIEQGLRSFYEGESSSVLPSSKSSEQRGGVGGYYYEPSVDEFHNAMRDPTTWKNIGSPDVRLNEQKDKSVGAAYIESKVPAIAALNKADIEHIGDDSPEYKAYSDYAYQEAKKNNPSLSRYSDLEITKNPFKKALGATIKYGAPAALGAEKSLALGLPRKAAEVIATNNPDSAGDASYDAMGAPVNEYHPEKGAAVAKGVKDLESLSPTANTLGNIGGYLAPIAPANLAARGMMASLGYEAAGPLTKAAISGLTGSAVSSGEGAAQDLIENPTIGGQELLNRTVPRAVFGGLGGTVLDPISQLSGRAQTAFEESPRWSQVKNQKDIGGNTNFISGIETTPAVRENVKAANQPREFRTAADIAADKVAPNIRESVDNQLTGEAGKINKQIEDYTKSPEGLVEHQADPVVDRLLSMADKGTVSMPVSGRSVSANKGSADAIRKNLQEFADFNHVSPEEAKSITEQHGGRVLSEKQAQVLGLPQESGKVHVVVPAKFNAEALLKKEDQIARNLRYDTREGGVDNPVLQEMNLGFKEIRDKFKYPNSSPETPFVDRRSPNRPTNEQWQSMQRPEGVNRNTPISETPEAKTAAPEAQSSVGVGDTEPPPVHSDPAPVAEVRGNKRYQEPSASEYAKMANGETIDKSGNGYQRMLDTADFAPGYRLRTSPNETANLNKLAQETDALSGKSGGSAPEDYTPEFPKSESEETGWGAPFRRDKSPFSPSRIGKDYGPDWSPNEDLYTANPTESISASEAPETVNSSASSLNKDIPVYEQRKQQLEEYMKTHDGHITKQIAGQKMGWDQKPEWQIDQLVKEGKLEQVPPGEKKLGQVDIEYRVPKNKSTDSLFPEVKDQIGQPSKSEFAKAEQTPDVGAVKNIVEKTDKAAEDLSPDELAAVHSYTSGRGEKVGTKEWDSATKKLTIDTPTIGGTLYHGTRLSKPDVDKILKNKSHSFDKPTSTSYNQGIASAAAYSRSKRGDVPVIFKIPEIDNGMSLASKKLGISGTNNEKEILLNNKDFDVYGSHKDSDGNIVIELKQKFKDPTQLEATLDDGTKVYGFSALRRKQHEALSALEEAKKGTGSATKEGAHRRVLGFKSGEGSPYENEQLSKEADKLGLRQQLEEVPATREYPGLRARAFMGGGEGPMNTLKDFAGFRLDPVLGAIAGEARNPYTALPNTPAGRIQQYLFRQGVPMYPLLEQRGGLGAARFGNEAADAYEESKRRNQ